MNNPYGSGTADWWYSGPRGDLWVEFKFLRDGKIPVRAPIDLAKHYLSALQQDWLDGRAREGRRVLVIVGCKDGGVVFEPHEWGVPMSAELFRARLMKRSQIADRILSVSGAFALPP